MSADANGIVAAGRYGPVVAFDRYGQENWQADLVVSGEQVLRPVGLSSNRVLVPITPGRVVMLDRSTGKETAALEINDPWSVAINSQFGAVVSHTGTLIIVNAPAGDLRATVDLGFSESVVDVRVWVYRDLVVVAWAAVGGSRLVVMNATDGSQRWRSDTPLFSSQPTLVGDVVCGAENVRVLPGGLTMAGRARCLSIVDGLPKWEQAVPGPFDPLLEVAAHRDTVVIIDVAGRVTALNRTSGEIRWRRASKRPQIATALQIVKSVAVVPTYGSGLLAFDLITGKPITNTEPGVGQTTVTIEDQAAADNLYLLVRGQRGAGEIWILTPPASKSTSKSASKPTSKPISKQGLLAPR